MLVLLQLLTIAVMIGMTYVVFQAFGSPRTSLLYTREEKEEWDTLIARRLGTWFTRTNIVGTLTSLATVYIFFIGNSKLFGGWIFLCSATIWFGSLVTNYFTKRICADKYIINLLNSPDQVGGVIASAFWRQTREDRRTAITVKWMSLLNIVAVIWLEFALFADISGRLLDLPQLRWRVLLLLICSTAVCYFTLRYGLRGFVFADLFQTPMILVGGLLILGGSILVGGNALVATFPVEVFRPLLPQRAVILFAVHVFFLNSFLVLVTESHWLRVWIFGRKETTEQVGSCAWTAGLWVILMLIGFLASSVSGGKVGEDAIVGLISQLNSVSPAFSVAFWIGGIGALFSTADAQVYALLLVWQFDTTHGKLRSRRLESLRPFAVSIVASGVFGALYAAVRYGSVPFEKLIFAIIPLPLNALPAFFMAVFDRKQQPIYIGVSLLLYTICSIYGILQAELQFEWTLGAALIPVGVSCVATAFGQKKRG